METESQGILSKTRSKKSFDACPECNSKRIWKDGIRHLNDGTTVQRYVCRDCSFRFSESKNHRMNSLAKQKKLNRASSIGSNRRVCVSLARGAKNLVEVESRTEKWAAGATKTDSATIKGKLLEFAWWMKKQGYAKTTITTREKILKILVKRGANLFDPESIKEAIAKQEWCNKRKVNAADAYSCFLSMHGMTWEPPRYRVVRQLPFVPTETEIDQVIAGCSRKFTPLLQLLKETGMRIGEACQLRWTDIDLENGTVRVTPEKGSNPRMLQISSKLKAMLSELQSDAKSEEVFPRSVRNQRRIFQRQRERIAKKLRDPRIAKITFHTFRHFKATMEYHKTKDILHVMRILGHKNINNTLIYTHLVDFKDDEYISKVATSPREACNLVEAGFEFVCEVDGSHIFRKRK